MQTSLHNYHWTILFLLLSGLFLLNISLGSIFIPPKDILLSLTGQQTSVPVWRDIVLNFRLSKAVTCALAGGALSLGGLLMQTFFRNPLAGPDVLGLSSGASLMVAILFLGHSTIVPFTVVGPWAVAIAASLGCAGVFFLILIFSRRLRDAASLLIVGLMIGAGTSSIVSVLQFISQAEELQTYIIWTFGSVGGMSWAEIRVLALVFLVGIFLTFTSSKSLNAWLLGDRYAVSLGVNLQKSRILIIVATCLLTGGVTAFCGPIAFIGIAVPHLVKLLMKQYNHRSLIPATILAGAIVLLTCDCIAQLPGSSQVLPLNAVTALLGAPVVIWIILKGKRIST